MLKPKGKLLPILCFALCNTEFSVPVPCVILRWRVRTNGETVFIYRNAYVNLYRRILRCNYLTQTMQFQCCNEIKITRLTL